MNEKERKEERQKLKELRKELEEKIKGIIPDALKSQMMPSVSDEAIEESIVLDNKTGKQVVESLLFATARPIMIPEISRIVKQLKPTEIIRFIEELKEEYIRDERSFRINEVAGGYEISTLPHFGMWIAKLEKEKKAKQASLAALESLAILSYKQPVTRVEIEEIRGVDVSGVLATLLERGFIKIAGRKEVPGRPLLYETTNEFLDHFGLKSLEDLPNINEIKTLVEDTIKKEELLRKEKIVSNVPVSDEEEIINEQPTEEGEEDVVTLAEKYDEISRQIADVKVMSSRKISEIIKPVNEEESKDKNEESQKEKEADTEDKSKTQETS